MQLNDNDNLLDAAKADNLLDAVKAAYNALEDKMGEDIIVLDVCEVSSLADYFIIASGNSTSQLKAMADHVGLKLHQAGINMRHSEGTQAARWILLDFGSIIVHIFNKEDREYYRLERLWGDGRTISRDELA